MLRTFCQYAAREYFCLRGFVTKDYVPVHYLDLVFRAIVESRILYAPNMGIMSVFRTNQ